MSGSFAWGNNPGGGVNAAGRGYGVGRFYLPDDMGYQPGAGFVTMVANRLYAVGRYSTRGAAAHVSAWGIWVATLGVGSIIRAGLWNVGTDGMPSTLLADLGSVSGAIVADDLVACSANIPAGTTVVFGIVAQGGTPQVPAALTTFDPFGVDVASANQIYHFGSANSYGLASDGVGGALGAWPTPFLPIASIGTPEQPRAGLAFS